MSGVMNEGRVPDSRRAIWGFLVGGVGEWTWDLTMVIVS